jgi:hypothetical protein
MIQGQVPLLPVFHNIFLQVAYELLTDFTDGYKKTLSPGYIIMKTYLVIRLTVFFCLGWWTAPDNLFAIQTHGGNEGVVVHQLSHVFFFVSMGTFIYWLREGRISDHTGWRLIIWFALLMGLWNLDVILMHFLDEQSRWIEVDTDSPWTVTITGKTGLPLLLIVYYLGKLDHLICVPALFFLYLGLRRIRDSLIFSGKDKAAP